MKLAHRLGSCLLVVAVGGAAAIAHDPQPTPPAIAPPAAATAPGTPAAAVEGFHAALGAGDRERALSWLDPRVVIFESGGAEMSRDEYASHHLESDMAFAGATQTEVVDRQAQSVGDTAWVMSRARTTGQFRDRPIDADSVETMVLQRDAGQWRIVHIHWSSHSRQRE
jgi:ketosteroid isomerase-like protein